MNSNILLNTFNCKQQYLKLHVLVEGGRVKYVLTQG